MKPRLAATTLVTTLALTAGTGGIVAAQETPSLMANLVDDVSQVESKLVGLARAIPAEDWDWRPMDGVRSVSEVFKHVIADNYLLTIPVGVPAPAETGITSDYQSAVAFESRDLSRDEIIETLEASFAHVKAAMEAEGDEALGEMVDLFGNQAPQQRLWVLATVHMHEHLGQMIAYARSNEVVPPWSRGGM
ncbi:MAG: DinB family protein [Gemmatimonadota bacterium]|jgi:uncharacterized damage-inducible protein DinB